MAKSGDYLMFGEYFKMFVAQLTLILNYCFPPAYTALTSDTCRHVLEPPRFIPV